MRGRFVLAGWMGFALLGLSACGGAKPATRTGAAVAPASQPTDYKGKTTYDFDDDTVEGDLVKPDEEYLERKSKSAPPPAQPAPAPTAAPPTKGIEGE